MQAEEIIKLKEWNSLSEIEKEFLKELANDEQEYNLLKKMLQVSAEETSDVPLLNDNIKIPLDTVISERKLKSSRLVWYAAAGILIIAFSTLLVYNYNKTTKQPAFVETKEESKKDESLQNNADENKKVAEVKIKSDSNLFDNKINTQTTRLVSNKNKYIAINPTVSSDPRLLTLVTEVY